MQSHLDISARDFNGLDPEAEQEPRKPRFRLVDDVELEASPTPDMLVEKGLPCGAFGVLMGLPETLKSFVVLDIGISVQTGEPFCGLLVKRGQVVYVVAEGRGRFANRVAAWKKYHGVTGSVGIRFLLEPVQFMEHSDTSEFLAALDQLPEPPVLVIVDTLARCLVGGEENSAKDVGLFIAGLDRIRAVTGAAVLVVHHTNQGGQRERGSTALRGAADMVMSATADGDFLTLRCEKMKDLEHFPQIVMRKHIIDLGNGETSCALNIASEDEKHAKPQSPRQMTDSTRKALKALREDFDTETGATATEWLRVSDLPDRTFYRAKKDLKFWGFVKIVGNRHRVTDEGPEL